MFKTLPTWTNRKLKWTRRCCEALVLIVGYVAPLATTVSLTLGKTESRMKMPLAAIMVSAFIISALARYFSKCVAKLSIYDSKSQTLKHILEAVGKLIVPGAILIVCFFIGTWFSEQLELYLKIVTAVVACYCVGVCIDRMVVGFLDDETEIREKAKEQNAIQSRRSIVRGE